MTRPKSRNTVFKIWLEPGVDATMRQYCDETGMSLNAFVRYAIGATLTTMTKSDERKSLESMASKFLMQKERSYSRLIRYSIMRACSLLSSDASRREQSQAPACAGSPPL